MARVSRFDLHRLDAVEVTASGALRVPARLARIGVLVYDDGKGNTWGELVPDTTLFDAGSLATMAGVAVTDLHPGALVTPVTRKGLSVGHVGDDVRRDGEYLAAPVYVTDADAIELVKRGERKDVSCGYTCNLDETPGVFDGQPYRAVQRDRVYNHLGLGPEGWGRAGANVALRLDAAHQTAAAFDAPHARFDSNTTTGSASRAAPHTEPAMTIKKKDGETPPPAVDDVKKDADTEMVPKKDADASAAAQLAKIAALEALVVEMTKQMAELKAALGAEESAEVTEADVPEAIADSIVVKRLAVLDAAREGARLVAPSVKLDGILKPRDIHAAAIVAVLPNMKLDGLSDDGVAGVFRGFVETARAKVAKVDAGNRKVVDVLAPDAERAAALAREDAAETVEVGVMQQGALRRWGQEPLGMKGRAS